MKSKWNVLQHLLVLVADPPQTPNSFALLSHSLDVYGSPRSFAFAVDPVAVSPLSKLKSEKNQAIRL